MVWQPQKGAQASFISADWCQEIFYGGERGGGKSDCQLGYQEDAALRYEGKSRGIMFRKTYAELEELQARAVEIFSASGAVYKSAPSASYPHSNCWFFPNGATIKMRYIENEKDYGRYHGHSYSTVSFDETTEYATPNGILKMYSTLRNAHGVPCTVRLTGNPGGVGHGWVKKRYIDGKRPYTPYIDPDSGMMQMFIPSKTSDNAILLDNDPLYRERIKAATGGNDALRKAWLDGDWDIVAGAFFECWDRKRHVIKPFEIPEQWMKFRSGDWGSARPFAFHWFSVVTDDYRLDNGLVLKRGALVCYREWYGMEKDTYNVGLKMTAEAVGAGIWQREQKDSISYGVLDPAAFSQDGGESIHERMRKGSGNNVVFKRADNSRVSKRGNMGGWDVMRARLIGSDESEPMLVFFDTCEHAIRTIPLLQHDKTNIEDIDTDMEDHCFAAGTIVWTKNGLLPIESLPESGIVMTPNGYEPYRSARLVKKNAEIVKLTFDDGTVIKCTPDHKFMLEDLDTVSYAKDLLNKELTCKTSPLSATQYKNTKVFGITNAAFTSSAKVLGFIEKYGKTITEKYLKPINCIILTKIEATTNYQTYNYLLLSNISGVSTANNPQNKPEKTLVRLNNAPLFGTKAIKAKNGIKSIIKTIWHTNIMRKSRLFVSVAAENIKQALLIGIGQNGVVTTAKHVRCVSVEPVQNEDVFCITVPKTGYFIIENGVAVSNCGDSVRYACMSRPWVRPQTIIEPPKFATQMTFNELLQQSRRERS